MPAAVPEGVVIETKLCIKHQPEINSECLNERNGDFSPTDNAEEPPKSEVGIVQGSYFQLLPLCQFAPKERSLHIRAERIRRICS
jgi:hypothetical protein